jgi:hypothetical protein
MDLVTGRIMMKIEVGNISRRAATVVVLGAALVALTAVGAGASTWCGDNGLVRFSFVEGDSLVSVFDAGEPQNGVTTVDVYAWLTDVDAVAADGEAFLHLGGFELELDIDGPEAFILEQEFPMKVLNVGQAKGSISAGLDPGQKLADGRAFLVRWKVMFQGRPENVRFGLDGGNLHSCVTNEGCAASGTCALYVGSESSRQLHLLVGAGYAPAWLNPTGQPDQTPVRGGQTWQEAGVFEAR